MTDNDRTDHMKILKSAGRTVTAEQEETINTLLGDLELSLEENEEHTLELPQPRRK